MKNYRHHIIALALISIFNFAQAQEEGSYNESVVVKGSYRPVITQHEKLYFPAVISDTLGTMEHDFQYSIMPVRLHSLYAPSRIRAARVVGEPATKLYNNYLRIGMGNYWSPLADLYWSSTRDKKKTYGVQVNHFSSWDKLPDYGPNHFGNTMVTLFGKYIFAEKFQLASDLSYEHDHNLYYGFTDNTLQTVLGQPRDNISISDYTASYNVASGNLSFRNMELDVNKLGYAANVHLSDLWSVWGANEMNLNLSSDVHYGFPILSDYKGVAYLHVDWEHYKNVTPGNSATLLGYNPTLLRPVYTNRNNIIRVNPYADFLFKGLNIHAGFLYGWNDSKFASNPRNHVYPDIIVSKKLMKDNLVLSLAATGGIEANSLNSMRQVNPYIDPDIDGGVATSHYDFIGHARWSLSRKLEANAEVSYSLRTNDLSFKLSPRYGLNNVYMDTYYDINRLTAGGDITFVNDEMITLRAGGHYYAYSIIDDNDPASVTTEMPYRPDWDAMVSAKVNYKDKWLFYLEGQLLGKMVTDGGQPLPMRYGVNAEVEYRHNRALSFFLKMDNLAFQRYWYWANYPSQRGLFIAGLTYTIPHK